MPPNGSEDWHLNRLCHLLTSKGGAKNRRGETISGSATVPALNRMPAALLKQSKVRLRRRFLASAKLERVRLCPRLIENVLRFLTLRRRVRPLYEIASAAGWLTRVH